MTKEHFKDILEAIKEQIDFDKQKAESLGKILNCDINPHDNSRLTNQLFKILHLDFPPIDDFCPIQTFCFELDFGRKIDTEKDAIEELWDDLILHKA